MRKITKLSFILLTSALSAKFAFGAIEFKKVDFEDVMPQNTQILDSSGKKVSNSAIQNKYVGLFFSASWCGACKPMGNSLKLYADKHKQYITIIMIGLDRTEETHWNYMKNYDNSFFTLPYKHKSFNELWKATGQSLGGRYSKSGGVPVLLLYDKQRNFVEGVTMHTFKDLNYTPWKQ